MTIGKVGRNGGEPHRQFFYCQAFQMVVEPVEKPLAGNKARTRHAEVEEAEYAPPRQGLRKVLEPVEAAGSIVSPDDGPDRRADDDVGV